jgi:NADH-quinone oxidoreductase subunit J
MSLSSLLFPLLAAFRAGTCLLVLAVQNPVHALLLLIRVFTLGTLLLFTLHRDYFALLFLIVYVGAIVVLFLFVIRRLEIKRVNTSRRFRDLFAYRHRVLGLLLLELLLLLSADAFDLAPFLPSSFSDFAVLPVLTERNHFTDYSALLFPVSPLRGLGGLLYTTYVSGFLIAALLLFLARVGAIAVTLVPTADPADPLSSPEALDPLSSVPAPLTLYPARTRKRQDPNLQARRHPAFPASHSTFASF